MVGENLNFVLLHPIIVINYAYYNMELITFHAKILQSEIRCEFRPALFSPAIGKKTWGEQTLSFAVGIGIHQSDRQVLETLIVFVVVLFD